MRLELAVRIPLVPGIPVAATLGPALRIALALGIPLFVALALGASPARAQDLDGCAEAAAREIGIAPRPIARTFLGEHESAVVIDTLPRDGCMAYLALGGAHARDLDLLAHVRDGRVLEEDVEPRAWGWVRACGEAGLEVAVIVHAFVGRGEARVIAFDDGPAAPPDLGRTVGACFARSAGARAPIADVGRLAPMRSLDEAIAASQGRARVLGATPIGRVIRGSLVPGQSEASRVALRGGRCHRIEALAGPELVDVGLRVLGPDGSIVYDDPFRTRDARADLCPDEDGGYVLQARAISGIGSYAVIAYELPEDGLGAMDPRARVEMIEVRARMAARGLAPRVHAWGLADRRAGQAFAIEVGAGCVAVSALRTRDLGEGDLDVRIAREDGGLVAWDVGPPSVDRGSAPIAWSCAPAPRTLRVQVSAHLGRGRFALVVGEERAP